VRSGQQTVAGKAVYRRAATCEREGNVDEREARSDARNMRIRRDRPVAMTTWS